MDFSGHSPEFEHHCVDIVAFSNTHPPEKFRQMSETPAHVRPTEDWWHVQRTVHQLLPTVSRG